MRFRVILSSEKPVNIPIDYRKAFISLLKRVIPLARVEVKVYRPYTFSVFMGKNVKINNGYFEGVKEIAFYFSTIDPMTALDFDEGIRKLESKLETINIGGNAFVIKNSELIRNRLKYFYREGSIHKVCFNTMSPIVVTRQDRISGVKNPDELFITYEDDENLFKERLLNITRKKYEVLTGKSLDVNYFDFEPVNMKSKGIRHCGGILKASIGDFILETDSWELLEFVYFCGIGVRTGQGFGMLDVKV